MGNKQWTKQGKERESEMEGIEYGTKRLIFSFIARGSMLLTARKYPLASLANQRNSNPLKFSVKADYLLSSFTVFKLTPPFKSSIDYFAISVVRGRYNFKTLLNNTQWIVTLLTRCKEIPSWK